MRNTEFDIRMEDRKLRRQTYGIIAQVVGLAVGALAAGVALATYVTSNSYHPFY